MSCLQICVDMTPLIVLSWYQRYFGNGGAAMYNAERKNRFLEYVKPSTKTTFKSLFNAFEGKEWNKDTDLCELSTEDIEDVVSDMTIRSSNTFFATKSRIKSYVKWCKEQGYPCSDAINGLKFDQTRAIRSSMFASPRHLQEFLDKIFPPVSEHTLDCIYRGAVWLLYGGMTLEQARSVTVHDVGLTHMLVCGQYEIYREAVEVFQFLSTSSKIRGVVKGKPSKNMRDRVPGDILLRGVRADKIDDVMTGVSLMHRISIAARGTGCAVSSKDLIRSGYFYRIFQAEQMGYEPDMRSLALTNKALSGWEDVESEKFFARANAAERSLTKEYEQWKRAFSINAAPAVPAVEEDRAVSLRAGVPVGDEADLARYRSTGLSSDELVEIAKLMQEGRFFVLPAKIGQPYWCIEREIVYDDVEHESIIEPPRYHIVQHTFKSIPEIMATEWSVGKTIFLSKETAQLALLKFRKDG